VPLHGEGTSARPGLSGHRHGGRDWAPRFHRRSSTVGHTPEGISVLHHEGVDSIAGLVLATRIEVTPHGIMRLQAAVTNDHARRYLVGGVALSLPVPAPAVDLLTLHGRWTREMHMMRERWTHGTRLVEHRGGRPTATRPPAMWAMTADAAEWSGQVWAVHLAWSGNHMLAADTTPEGHRYLQVGELLHPGEVCLEPGETYTTPWVLAMWSGEGLTPASWGYHREVRSRPHHPGANRPRPVLVSTWEAGYFDQDPQRLRQLAERAVDAGCERFVLDDGWFGSRRDDRRGLGDWVVSPEVYPQGLRPWFDELRALGLDIGLWVEPEMVNPDSDLFRAHPDWVLGTPGYEPVLGRHQLVLDLTRPEVFDHVLERLSSLIGELGLVWLKWDMNRDHVAGSLAGGAAGTHAQTLAVSALLDTLRARCPQVDIETCASGGGRGDLGMLERTVRVWASDCNDPVERQRIQRGWSLLVPPEVIGGHIGPPRAHTTGRRSSLGFRGLTEIFGHLGVEWDLTSARADELADLADIIAVHRRFRPLVHGGDWVRFDVEPPSLGADDPTVVAHGVYACDRSEALVAWIQLRTSSTSVPAPWRLPGLHPERLYAVAPVPLPGGLPGMAAHQPIWLTPPVEGPIVLSGHELAVWGLQPPVLWPEHGVLVHLEAVDPRREP
jgi:alpha-galactosidase